MADLARTAEDTTATSHCFVTIDAETDVIQDGIRIISTIREKVEAREKVRIPLVWFVRCQRAWGRLSLFPYSQTLLYHDRNVVPHDFGWSRLGKDEAAALRRQFHTDLAQSASRLKDDRGAFLTYETAPPSLIAAR